MAVFLSASDESDGGFERSTFWHGGWVAPETDWYNYFAPAWQERVTHAKPEIPYLHMTDIRDSNWRAEHNLSWLQAEDKLNAATAIIDTMGSLYPIATYTSGDAFLDAFGKKKIIQDGRSKKTYRFLIDHFSFNAYVLSVLFYIKAKHPEAEKVDFIVERKEGVFEKLKQFYDSFANSLVGLGYPEVAKYLGELTAVGKERAPVQAADMLCWHTCRASLGTLKGNDAVRAAAILKRRGAAVDLPDKLLHDMARVCVEKMNEKDTGVSEI